MKNWFLIGLLCILLTGCGLGKQQRKPLFTPEQITSLDKIAGEITPTATDNIETLPITPLEAIRRTFDENPMNAGNTYGDKWIKTRGTLVLGPNKELIFGLSSYTITLENNGKEMDFLFWGSAKEEQMKMLKKGQILTIAGQVSKIMKKPIISLANIITIENPPAK